ADVTNLRLGIVDESRTPESRELIAVLTESKSFRLSGYFFSSEQLGASINRGDLDAGVVIPFDYSRDLQRERVTTVQALLNAMNANTAATGQGYVEGVIQSYNNQLREQNLALPGRANQQPSSSALTNTSGSAGALPTIALNQPGPAQASPIILHPAFLYNPGLKDSWFIVTGVF